MIDKNGKVKLATHQLQFIKSEAPIAGIYGGRGCGKTVALSWLVATNLINGKNQIVYGINFRQLAETIVPEVIKRLDELNLPYRYDKQINTIHCNGGTAHFFSYVNYEAVRGLTEIEYLICDEIALAKQDLLAVAAPCLRGNFKPKIRFCSTPRAGSWWNSWIREGMDTGKIEIYRGTMKDMVDKEFVTQESFDMQFQAIDDEHMRRQEIYGEILDDVIENCIVDIEDFVTVCRNNSDKNYYCGIDFARFGNDATCIVVRNGYEIVECVSLTKADTAKIVSEWQRLNNIYHFVNTYLDATGGYDIGFYDTLKVQHRNITEVNFASRSPDPTCANARTHMYDKLAKAIKSGFYIDTYRYKDIYDALKATSCLVNNAGKKSLQSKDKIKEIIGASPDATDALALTFFEDENLYQVKISPDRQRELMSVIFG